MLGVGLHQLFQPVFGPTGSGGNQTTTQQSLPGWMVPYAKGTLGFAKQVANQPYKPYSGTLVAGLDPMQQQSYDFTQNQLGVAGGQINQFMQGMNPLTKFQPDQVTSGAYTPEQVKAGQLSQTDLQPYMDPYTHRVVNTSLAALDRSRQQQQMQNAANASSAGAFGGSRQGIVQAQTNEAAQRQAGALSSGLYSQGFQQAQQAAQQDIASRMQASLANQQTGLQAGLSNQQNALQAALANQTAGIQGAGVRMDAGRLGAMMAGQGQQANAQSAAALEQAGMAQQGQRQNEIQANYEQFLEKRGYPEQQLNIMLRALGMPAGQTTVSTGPPGNPWMSALGGAMGGAGLGGALGGPWGMGLGALGGGLMGLLG